MSASLFCKTCGAALPDSASECAACGSLAAASNAVSLSPASPPSPLSAPPPCSLAPGTLLARRYRILRQIGQGGFATVYKARDRTQRNRPVAIKQIHLETPGLQGMLDITDTYNREVNHLSLLRHKSLPRFYSHFADAQHWYIAMEYIEGKTLEEILQSTKRGFLPIKRTLDIGIALCDALQYLHTQRPPIIFRDVKPANIILTRSGWPYLIDFGIARLYRPGWKDTGPLGTPGYAAPEQYGRRAHTTPQTDIYGLGATLQTLLTGKEPLDIRQNGIPPERARAIPQRLQTYLARMLEPDATARPRNMAEVKKTLLEIKAQLPSQKLKSTSAFVWEICSDIPIWSRVSLFMLLFIGLFSVMGAVWGLLWIFSALAVGSFTIIRSIFKIHQARKENAAELRGRELFAIIWKQLMSSLPVALLISLFLYYLQQFLLYPPDVVSPDNVSQFNLFALSLMVGVGILAGLGWLIWWLFHLRASRRYARQQAEQQLLQQTVHNHP